LIVIDPAGASAAEVASANSVPAWLASAEVMRRMQFKTDRNWKFVHHFVQSSPQLFFDDPPDGRDQIGRHAIGPLGLLFTQYPRAVLVRVIPKFAEQTDIQVIDMGPGGTPNGAEFGTDAGIVAEQVNGAATGLSWFDRIFAQWYWTLMSAGA
jgi:hypothetical protein